MKTVVTANISDSTDQALSDLAKAIKIQQVCAPIFVTSVLSISEDHSSAKVKLCTGSIIDVPKSVLKNVTYLGTVTCGDETRGIASGEIDISTDVGKLIQQMANEIIRLSGTVKSSQEALRRLQNTTTGQVSSLSEEESQAVRLKPKQTPFDTVLPGTVIKIPFQGVAGNLNNPFFFVFYAAPAHQYIQEWEVLAHPNCFFVSPPIVGGIDTDGKVLGLQFFPDAPHGTPLGTPYSATINLYVVLVQRTT